jgi:hypothetical protein
VNRQSGRGQEWRPRSGDKEDFIRVWALDLSSWGKTAHVNIAGVGRMRAGHKSGLSWDRRSIGDVSRRSCRRGRCRLRRGSRGGILRRRFGRRSWCRSGRRIGELGLCRLGPLITKPVRSGRSISAGLAAALTGCKHDQECGGGDDPVRRFHGDNFTSTHDWAPSCNANFAPVPQPKLLYGPEVATAGLKMEAPTAAAIKKA